MVATVTFVKKKKNAKVRITKDPSDQTEQYPTQSNKAGVRGFLRYYILEFAIIIFAKKKMLEEAKS